MDYAKHLSLAVKEVNRLLSVDVLNVNALSDTYFIRYISGRPCLMKHIAFYSEDARNVSPRLSEPELLDWLFVYLAGIRACKRAHLYKKG